MTTGEQILTFILIAVMVVGIIIYGYNQANK